MTNAKILFQEVHSPKYEIESEQRLFNKLKKCFIFENNLFRNQKTKIIGDFVF